MKVDKIHLLFATAHTKAGWVNRLGRYTEILNPDITDGGPLPGDAGKVGEYIYYFVRHNRR